MGWYNEISKKNSFRKAVLSSCILTYFSFIHQSILLYKFEEWNYDLLSIYNKLFEIYVSLGILLNIAVLTTIMSWPIYSSSLNNNSWNQNMLQD